MEGREVPDIWISKGRMYPPSRVNTQASVEIWISSVHVFRSGLLSRCLSLFPPLLSGRVVNIDIDVFRPSFSLLISPPPPFCFSDQNNWSQESPTSCSRQTRLPQSCSRLRLPPYYFPASPHLAISHALFPQSPCYGNSGFLLLIHICLNKYWHRSLHIPFEGAPAKNVPGSWTRLIPFWTNT